LPWGLTCGGRGKGKVSVVIIHFRLPICCRRGELELRPFPHRPRRSLPFEIPVVNRSPLPIVKKGGVAAVAPLPGVTEIRSPPLAFSVKWRTRQPRTHISSIAHLLIANRDIDDFQFSPRPLPAAPIQGALPYILPCCFCGPFSLLSNAKLARSRRCISLLHPGEQLCWTPRPVDNHAILCPW